MFAKTMASADSLVSYFDCGGVFANVYLEVPTMASGTAIDVYVASDVMPTDPVVQPAFKQLMLKVPATATAQFNTYIVAASLSANGSTVPLVGGFRYYKLKATDSAPTAATTFKIVCSDN